MTAPAYPRDMLPLPILPGYALQEHDTSIRTETATGLMIQREVAPNGPLRITATWRVSNQQATVLEGWRSYVGLGYWTMPIRVPLGLIDHQVRFIGPFSDKRPISGRLWEISATIEVRRQEKLSGDEMAVLLAYGLDDVLYGSSALHKLVHQDLPGPLSWS